MCAQNHWRPSSGKTFGVSLPVLTLGICASRARLGGPRSAIRPTQKATHPPEGRKKTNTGCRADCLNSGSRRGARRVVTVRGGPRSIVVAEPRARSPEKPTHVRGQARGLFPRCARVEKTQRIAIDCVRYCAPVATQKNGGLEKGRYEEASFT